MQLKWMKCQFYVWCKLFAVNLDHEHFEGLSGVYIIWHGGPSPSVVYIGQGMIRDRLAKHRIDPRIEHYAELDLYVTWARVEEELRDGVEAYLARKWRPKVGTHITRADTISVNSPWE